MIDYKYQLQRLLNKVNRVTSPLRHGRTPPMMALAELCDRQKEIEEVIASQSENPADGVKCSCPHYYASDYCGYFKEGKCGHPRRPNRTI